MSWDASTMTFVGTAVVAATVAVVALADTSGVPLIFSSRAGENERCCCRTSADNCKRGTHCTHCTGSRAAVSAKRVADADVWLCSAQGSSTESVCANDQRDVP